MCVCVCARARARQINIRAAHGGGLAVLREDVACLGAFGLSEGSNGSNGNKKKDDSA